MPCEPESSSLRPRELMLELPWLPMRELPLVNFPSPSRGRSLPLLPRLEWLAELACAESECELSEWGERLPGTLDPDRLTVRIDIAGDTVRLITLEPGPAGHGRYVDAALSWRP